MNGHFSVGPLQIPLVYNYNQIFQRTDFGVMAYYETRRDQLGFYTDAIYAKWTDHLLLPHLTTVDYKATQTYLDAGALYSPWGPQSPWDVILGTRYSAFHANFRTIFQNGAKGESWWDPVFGLRYSKRLNDLWQFSLRGEWGATNSSSARETLALLKRPLAPHLDADLGYRYFVVNDQVGDFTYHVKLSGPVFGGTYEF